MSDLPVVASACAKVILFGEHAVVYGEPAIAAPITDLRSYVSVEPTDSDFKIIATDLDEEVFKLGDAHPLSVIARQTLSALNHPAPPVQLILHSEIPISGGLGSGASVSTAICRALLRYLGRELPTDRINDLVYETEKLYHGTPSGIDNTVIVYEQSIFYQPGHPLDLIPTEPLHILIADTGIASPTKNTVGDVRKLYEAQPEIIKPKIEQIGKIVQQAKQAMTSDDISHLGDLMNENHRLLQELTVSSDELDTLVTAAKNAGALGAKLSGGGRGGSMIALVTDTIKQNVASRLYDFGAKKVFETTLGSTM